MKPKKQAGARLSKVRLAKMIEEATVDAYGEAEQATGWFTMLEQYLSFLSRPRFSALPSR